MSAEAHNDGAYDTVGNRPRPYRYQVEGSSPQTLEVSRGLAGEAILEALGNVNPESRITVTDMGVPAFGKVFDGTVHELRALKEIPRSGITTGIRLAIAKLLARRK
jgi:hypothetical protein